jgi:glyceraldehyde 3-phosphate dehydrogenase
MACGSKIVTGRVERMDSEGMINVVINGLGRIGRATMKIILEDAPFNLVAVNDIVSTANLAYLLKYDTVYGRWEKSVGAGDMELRIGGASLPVLSERDPGRLPWRGLAADLVFECTGLFSRREDLTKHIAAGARFVILSAPAEDEDLPTVVHGANTSSGGIEIISCASLHNKLHHSRGRGHRPENWNP